MSSMGPRLQEQSWLAVLCLSFTLMGCSFETQLQTVSGNCSNRVSTIYAGPAESSYCSGSTAYGGSTVTITGNAQYRAYQQTGSGLGAATASPIRYAEIVAYNGSTPVQCGETDGSGNYSLTLPQSSETATIRINARGDNSNVKASVLNCPEENIVHSVEDAISQAASGTLNFTVLETGDKAGAFNILDQIVNANTFLNSTVSSCSGTYTGCTDVSVASKVAIYWENGFNPRVYAGQPLVGGSFYIPSYQRLFILGGIEGDTDTSDTDHFDNTIILHEYGHFLEDVYTISDSQGGAHFGTKQIDPRLAWSEGWGNAFQAFVLNNPYYIDSQGTPAGSSSNILDIPLEDYGTYCATPANPGCDLPSNSGEGNFREFAISKFLWDSFDTDAQAEDNDDDGIDSEFSALWASITATTSIKNSSEAFRNFGLLLERQNALSFGSNWASLRSLADHLMGFTTDYAHYVEASGTCSYSITPSYNPSSDDGSFANSFLFENNDFYYFKYSGPTTTVSFTLEYSTDDTGAGEEPEVDLDLYIYDESANYGNGDNIPILSQDYFDNVQATSETETDSGTLSAGNYLINVKVFTGVWLYSSGNSDYSACTDNSSATFCASGSAFCTGNNAAIGSGSNTVCHNEQLTSGGQTTYTLKVNTGGGDQELCSAARPWF